MKGGGGASWTTAPTTAVISPTKSSTPPKITKPKSVTQAKKWPERIVPKHEETASTETRGPMAISAIPTKNIAVLVFSSAPKDGRDCWIGPMKTVAL